MKLLGFYAIRYFVWVGPVTSILRILELVKQLNLSRDLVDMASSPAGRGFIPQRKGLVP